MKTLYIVPSYDCNLKCPHCSIRDIAVKSDFEAFLEVFSGLNYKSGILFGGEPLLLSDDKLHRVFAANRIDSISTNLSFRLNEKTKFLADAGVSVSTSWNPSRFTSQQYEIWLDNIKDLDDSGVHVLVMITLTPDLFESRICAVMDDIDRMHMRNFEGILFEPLLPSSIDHIKKCDGWLWQLTETWNYGYANVIAARYHDGNIHSCADTYTLLPDGSVSKYCPGCEQPRLLVECLKCKYNKVCKPCIKQSSCSFFSKLYEKA